MKRVGASTGIIRQVYYLNIHDSSNWVESLPLENWLGVIICEDAESTLFDKVSSACLANSISYACFLGQNGEKLHDRFDELICELKIKRSESIENHDNFDDEPITTWHDEFNEAFWFALKAAVHPVFEIKAVVVIDISNEQNQPILTSHLDKINKG